ncbi:predicted protein [Naegleria gruberi]|uniref:Predicted protein n=1 Tax=Naegleria gruberi TaxID=5762 RepID=D2V384_NAEGR|nr:uncharacterized protein NAEGRDRAFT_46343 [Naegleria gruberi]EFC48591.1 predicted protein [Naegleria gruberi]|eukprot:XP_002681335.1 predicted protein [Naegleria gruberi strain NEG-M]
MSSIFSRSASLAHLDSQTVTSLNELKLETRKNYRKTTTENVFSHPSYREMIADIVRAKEEVTERKLAQRRAQEEEIRRKEEEERIQAEELRKELAKVKVPVNNRKNLFSNRMQSRKDSQDFTPLIISKNVESLDLIKVSSNSSKIILRERPRRNTTPVPLQSNTENESAAPITPPSPGDFK